MRVRASASKFRVREPEHKPGACFNGGHRDRSGGCVCGQKQCLARCASVLRARGNKGEDTMDDEATASRVQLCGYVQRRGARVRERVRLCLRARTDERACVCVGASGTETTLVAIPQESTVAGGLAWMDRLLEDEYEAEKGLGQRVYSPSAHRA